MSLTIASIATMPVITTTCWIRNHDKPRYVRKLPKFTNQVNIEIVKNFITMTISTVSTVIVVTYKRDMINIIWWRKIKHSIYFTKTIECEYNFWSSKGEAPFHAALNTRFSILPLISQKLHSISHSRLFLVLTLISNSELTKRTDKKTQMKWKLHTTAVATWKQTKNSRKLAQNALIFVIKQFSTDMYISGILKIFK